MWNQRRQVDDSIQAVTIDAEDVLLKTGALQSAIFNSANFSSIATDAKGVIQIFNVGAERMLGYTAADVLNKNTPADISDPQEVIARAKALSVELGTPITPGFEALVFKASRGIEDIYELTYIRKDGTRFPAVVSVTALRDDQSTIIGYLLIGTDNTARKQIEERVRASFKEVSDFKAALDEHAIVAFTNPLGKITYVNDKFCAISKYSRSELLGKDHRIINSGHHSKEFFREMWATITDGRTWKGELRNTAKDGSAYWVDTTIVPFLDAGGKPYQYVAIRTDITARKQTEEVLLKTGALQSAIFNSANFSSIATDAKGVIQIFNVGAERMLGYTAIEVLNRITPADISDPQEVVERARVLSLELDTAITPGFEALVFKASRGIEDIYELTYIRKDGSSFPAVVSVTALRDAQDVIIGYLLIGTDNTARKQVEDALKENYVELENAKVAAEMAMASAEKANLAKSEFLSSMSHELRTPLNAVLGFAQLLASEIPPPSMTQKQSIQQITQAGWYLLRLINEILDLAMIESGKVTMSQETISLTDVLQDCQAMIEPQAQKRGIQMSFPNADSCFYVHADRTRVKQVMINLLSNAIKYNRVGGAVSVQCAPSGENRVRVSVQDTGTGLTAEQLKQLFQPFNRLGQEGRAEEGTGIGLIVTKQLVECMGGAIGVTSTVCVGSVFWVEFVASSAPSLASSSIGESSPYEWGLKAPDGLSPKRTVLYIEDNPANLALVEKLIARRGDLTILTAIDGHLGIKLASIHQPDVILMDINLPGISGFEALEILREDPATAHIPIMALSANAIPRDIEKGLAAGFFRYLTKPIKLNEFMEALDSALKYAEKKRFRKRIDDRVKQ